MYVTILSLIVGLAVSASGQDPTQQCFPPLFETSYINLINWDRGNIYVDFTKQKYTEVSAVTKNWYIYDFAKLESYAISGEGNYTKCKSFKLQQSQVMYKCLPPYAKLVTEASGWLHHIASEKMYLRTYDVESESDKVSRYIFSIVGGQPNWPVMTQEFDYHGTTSVYLYLNPLPTVSNQKVFVVPESCQTHEIKTSLLIG